MPQMIDFRNFNRTLRMTFLPGMAGTPFLELPYQSLGLKGAKKTCSAACCLSVRGVANASCRRARTLKTCHRRRLATILGSEDVLPTSCDRRPGSEDLSPTSCNNHLGRVTDVSQGMCGFRRRVDDVGP